MSGKEILYKRKLTKQEKFNVWASRIFLWISILVIAFPIWAIISASLSPGTSFYENGIIKSSFSK